MDKLHSAASSKGDSANDKLRPSAHDQFRLLPAPIRGAGDWNARVEYWATAA